MDPTQYYLNILQQPCWQLQTDVQDAADTTAADQQLIPYALYHERRLRERAGVDLTSSQAAADRRIEPPVAEVQTLEQPVIEAPIPEPTVAEAPIPEPTVAEVQSPQQLPIAGNLSDIAPAISRCQLCVQRQFGENYVSLQPIYQHPQAQHNCLLVIDEPIHSHILQRDLLNNPYRQLFLAIVKAVNLNANVFMTAALKCYRPAQYDEHYLQDKRIELQHCRPFLEQEIASLAARVIIPMGSIELLRYLIKLDDQTAAQQIIGTVYPPDDILINSGEALMMPGFHPAFLIRNPLFKAKALQHWIKIAKLYT